MIIFEVILIIALAVLVLTYRLAQLSAQKLILIVMGALLGSLIGSLLSAPISALGQPYSQYLPIAVTVVLSVSMAIVFYSKHEFMAGIMPRRSDKKNKPSKLINLKPVKNETNILVDTSAIIDGRIGDIVSTGFIPGRLIVPKFILAELQNIADSDDAMRRGRGRRGLEILNEMRQNDSLDLDIIEEDPLDIKEVDHKLVKLAKKYNASILTTDYNLNRVATIEGVKILNINELANAIRAVVLPGEVMRVSVVQQGKEEGQGVGYLPDGTMIVVDGGDKLIGKELDCQVTRIFQTVAGKMIFATPNTSLNKSRIQKPKNVKRNSQVKNNHKTNKPKR